jgi:hypothetical protein
MYNPWSRKTIWISQITTGSSSKRGSSFKVLIYPGPAVLRIGNVWKTRQLFVKIKFSLDTDIGRHEWHAGGGGQWTNERVLGLRSLHKRNLWMCWKSRRWWAQHERHFHLYEVTGNQLRPSSLLTQASGLYTREICACVEKAGVGGHNTKCIFTCMKLLGINCDPAHYRRSPY